MDRCGFDGFPLRGEPILRVLWGPAVDMLLADEQVADIGYPGEVLWAAADHLGSVRDVVDSSGTLRIHRQFDSYGNIVGETHYDEEGVEVESNEEGFVTVAFAFTGRYFDPHTSLQNNLNRWYDPTTGSWISEDPIGFAGDPSNVFRYVVNAPTMYTDPSGFATVGAGFGGDAHVAILHFQCSADVSVGFWWIIPMDICVGIQVGAGPAIGASVGSNVHGTWTNAESTEELNGEGREIGAGAAVGSVDFIEGGPAAGGPNYHGVTVGVGPTLGAGVHYDNTETASSTWYFPWNAKAKWWFGIPNPFARRRK
jgi:RHS repeat-associated protein